MRPPGGIAFESSDSAPRVELALDDASLFADGQSFGSVGLYESVVGRAHFGINPDALNNLEVMDLDKAPRDAGNLVQCAADVAILRPKDPARANGRLLFEFCNRGGKGLLSSFNDAPHPTNVLCDITDPGNGFLMRAGYTMAWAAWQGDILPGDGRMVADVPVATDNGAPLTGLVRSEFIAEGPGRHCFPLSGFLAARSYPTVTRDTRAASLTMRQYRSDAPIEIPSTDWSFAVLDLQSDGTGDSALIPSERHLYLSEGFKPGWIYELTYEAKDPLVLGLGHVMVRDLVSFLRYDQRAEVGTASPTGRGIEKVYCWGASQGGRMIRDYVYRGFNADWCGRRIFDGALPHVAGAGRIWLNHRFAQPTRLAGLQHEDSLYWADRFPFSYATSRDHITGQTAGLLNRPASDPLVIHTQSATEYWNRRASLVHTDTRGNDLEQPEGVRIYLFSGSQHAAGPMSKAALGRRIAEQTMNPLRTTAFLRALLTCLDGWASGGQPPPPSRIPSTGDGTLVSYAKWHEAFPRIPRVTLPRSLNGLPLYDYGPDADDGLITIDPPETRESEDYAILVPSVDEDGNESAGVRAPTVQAPLGTYTGWNMRDSALSPGGLARLEGGYIPFSETRSERNASGDPRRSVEERYSSGETYRDAIARAARVLLSERLLLEEDVDRILKAAERETRLNALWRVLDRTQAT